MKLSQGVECKEYLAFKLNKLLTVWFKTGTKGMESSI